MQQFKNNTHVRIKKYGQRKWISKQSFQDLQFTNEQVLDEKWGTYLIDTNPDLIGKTGTIREYSDEMYYLNGYYFPFNEEQLELVTPKKDGE